MTSADERRREERHLLPVTSPVRILTDQGTCSGDIRDVSRRGLGVEYFDYFGTMDLSPGTRVILKFNAPRDSSLSRSSSEPTSLLAESGRPDGVETISTTAIPDPAGSPNPELELEATVTWIHLNRIGFEISDEYPDQLFNDLFPSAKQSENP